MRIQNDAIATTAASQAARTESAVPSVSSTRVSSAATSGGDQVDLSSLSGNVAASLAAMASQRAARVSQLAALYAKGQYQVDSGQLSRAMVSQAVAGDPLEEDR